MTVEEFKHFMSRHKLTPQQMADLVGVSYMAVHQWLTGRRSIAKPIGRILRLLDKHPELIGEFAA